MVKIVGHLVFIVVILTQGRLIPWSSAHGPSSLAKRQLADSEPNQSFNVDEEDFIHTPAGFDRAGAPTTVTPNTETARLKVTVVDNSSGELTACRVNVIGPDGNFYEPSKNRLKDFSRQKLSPNETHGPSRYFGWYFYTRGQFYVTVPAGQTRIEVWKGYEYQPIHRKLSLAAGQSQEVKLPLTRTVPMQDHGYYSGDPHIHLFRRNKVDDQRALDLIAAEDIQYGFLLCMNDPSTYTGAMQRQEWPQTQGFGPASVLFHGRYGIASGQEYRASTYGHICLLMHEQMVLKDLRITPDNWPVFSLIGHETRRLGGFSFHAHGGYAADIFSDYVRQLTDGVELLQMAHYRGIGLTGWYHILNAGFRFPGLAGSDFPYNRCLGDCRNYVLAETKPDFREWANKAAKGCSFFTTGPLLMLDVNGQSPGDTIELPNDTGTELTVNVRVRSEVTPVEYLDLLVNGKTVKSLSIPHDVGQGCWHELQHKISKAEPCWIAARAHSLSPTGRPDAEAHTSPVYVYVDGKKPFNSEDRDWLIGKLDGRIEAATQRMFAEKQQVLEFLQESRKKLCELTGDEAVGGG